MGSLRSSAHAHDLGHLDNESLAEYLTGALVGLRMTVRDPGVEQYIARRMVDQCFRCCAHPPPSWLSPRERSRQPEPWEHAVVEAGHGADPVAGEGEDE